MKPVLKSIKVKALTDFLPDKNELHTGVLLVTLYSPQGTPYSPVSIPRGTPYSLVSIPRGTLYSLVSIPRGILYSLVSILQCGSGCEQCCTGVRSGGH